MLFIQSKPIVDAVLQSTNVPENDYPVWAAGGVYALDAQVLVLGAETHQVYKSLVAANSGNTPATSPTKWKFVGQTNRWQMFDSIVGSQTSNPESIDCTFAISGGIVDAIGLVNVSAASVRIVMTSTYDGLVYDKTFSMINNANVTDVVSVAFSPVMRRSALLVSDLPLYTSGTLRIVLNEPGGVARCGTCVIGQKFVIGDLNWGSSYGIADYSEKSTNDFGQATLIEGPYSKRGDYQVEINTGRLELIMDALAARRAKATVYCGSSQFGITIIHGFYEGFSLIASNPKTSICQISIKGLI